MIEEPSTDETAEKIKEKIARNTRTAVRKIQFAFLGETEEYIANKLKLTSKGWWKVKTGNGNFSERRLHQINLLLRIHRPSPIKLFKSDVANLANAAIKNTDNIDDLETIFKYMEKMLNVIKNDCGFVGLFGSLAFALWMDGYDQGKGEESLKFLDQSIKSWKEAYENANDDSKHIFEVNYTSAKVWKDAKFNEGLYNRDGGGTPNKEHSEVFHRVASKRIFHDLIPLRKDALEQAALLKDKALIDNDLMILFKLLKPIPLNEQKEIVLPELREMDGYTEVETRPSFQEWVSSF